MNIKKGMNGRLIAIAESDTELRHLRTLDITEKSKGTFSCEDTLLNRLLLNYEPQVLERWNDNTFVDLTGVLRNYQEEDVGVMCEWGSLINANDMGLGKTLETIYYCQTMRFKKILIVCPKAVVGHWYNQFKQWASEYIVEVLPSSIFLSTQNANVVIVNYEKLYSVEQFKGVLWDLVVCDEAHRIKNHASQIGQIIHEIPAKNRLALTGTPVTNMADDIFNILKWVDPRSVGNGYWHFANVFCYFPPNPFGRKIEGLTKDKERLKLLQRLLSSYVIRSTKEQVMQDLPDKGVYEIKLTADEKQRTLYNNVKKLVFDSLPEHCTILNAAMHMLRLIQVTSNPQLFEPDCPNPKFEYILEAAMSGRQLVVFSRFAETVHNLVAFLQKNEITTVAITGSMSVDERAMSVYLFKNKKANVICGTIGAMGQGIDGLQVASSTAIFIDSDWSPQINQQAEDRLYRFGQTMPVDIYYLQIEKSVDQYVGKRLEEKAEDVRLLLEDL